jgi:hypothetical protein
MAFSLSNLISFFLGDITKKKEVKLEREKAMKLRQQDRITAAEVSNKGT